MKKQWLGILGFALLFSACTDSNLSLDISSSSETDGEGSSSENQSAVSSVDSIPENELGFSVLGQDSLFFRIVLWDYQPNHPDFETYDARASQISQSPILPGYTPFLSECYGDFNVPTDITIPLGYSPSGSACEDGYECGSTKSDGSPVGQAYYGLYKCNENEIYTFRSQALACTEEWANPVYVTKGMVKPDLQIIDPTDPLTWTPVRNESASMPCHSAFLNTWFSYIPGINVRIESSLALQRVANTMNTYDFDSDQTSGFFPLDESNRERFAPDYSGTVTYGPQGLDLWCPPYGLLPKGNDNPNWMLEGGYSENSTQEDKKACQLLLMNGGPRSPTAVSAVVNSIPSFANRLHNYSFTMMGYTKFKYNAGEVFEITGDDDIWVFVDGKLVADLGGTHPPAQARVDFFQVANARGGWTNKSEHTLHFFVAERQGNASNLKIRTTLSEVLNVPWEHPRIIKAVKTKEKDQMRIYTNLSLSNQTIANLTSPDYPGIIARHLASSNDIAGSAATDTLVAKFQTLRFLQRQKDYYVYEAQGFLCLQINCSKSDTKAFAADYALSFNYAGNDGHKYYLQPSDDPITSTTGRTTQSFSWAPIISP